MKQKANLIIPEAECDITVAELIGGACVALLILALLAMIAAALVCHVQTFCR